jgi:hypothetical protein
MTQASDRYQETRDVREDQDSRQKFEHELIDRKTTWGLACQSILFVAYGVTLRGDKPSADIEAYAKLSLKKYRPMAARNEDKKVFSGLL